tara:strand:+ start:1471 stop:2070 length:600 start_codon:yes stop_codon:yes gene_type:complete
MMDLKNVRRTAIFPTLVYSLDCSHLNRDVLKVFKTTDMAKDNFFWNPDKNDHYVLSKNKKLIHTFESIINELVQELGYVCPFRMSTSWFTYTAPGQRVEPHHHTNSVWSAVFYFNSDCSSLIFDNPPTGIDVERVDRDYDLIMTGSLGFPAKHGTMLVFPSGIRHFSDRNKTDKIRHSLAMNFMPYGYVKCGDSSFRYR